MRQWYRILFPKNYLDRRKRAGFLFVLPALLFFGSVFLLPLAQSVLYSFYRIQPGGAREFVGLGRYEKVLTDSTFWSAVGNTVQLLLLSVPVTVVFALAVALGLNRISSLKWRNVWASMYFLPFATSLVAAALIWQWIYEPVYGFLNYALSFVGIPPQKWLQSLAQVLPSIAAVSVWVRIGFDTMIFLAALQSIPQEYYEAADIDGANAWQRLRYITLPMLNAQIVMVVHPRADLQLQGLRPGLRHDAGRAGGREPDHHHAAVRHGVQILPLRRRLGDGGVRLRHAHGGDARAVAALPQADRVLTT